MSAVGNGSDESCTEVSEVKKPWYDHVITVRRFEEKPQSLSDNPCAQLKGRGKKFWALRKVDAVADLIYKYRDDLGLMEVLSQPGMTPLKVARLPPD